MKPIIPCLAVGGALLLPNCVGVDDPAVPVAPARSESALAKPESIPVRAEAAPVAPKPAPVRKRTSLFGPKPAPARSALFPSRPSPAPERTALIPSQSESNADVPGWLNGYERGRDDARRGLSKVPDRYDFLFSNADRAGFYQGYNAGYGGN